MIQEKNTTPQKISIDEILKKSFFYWKSTLGFQAMVTLLYFGIIIFTGLQLFYYYFGDTATMFTPELVSDTKKFMAKINEIISSENGSYFQIIMALIKASLFPLNIGLFKIFSLIDENKKPQLSDIFDGFNGSQFFKFWGYAIFWNMMFQIGINFFLLPGILWVLMTLFVGPLLYYTPMRMFEAIQLSTKVVFGNWALILPCAIVAFLFSYSGFIVFFIGFLFTFPFWNAIIYTLFKKFFNIKFV